MTQTLRELSTLLPGRFQPSPYGYALPMNLTPDGFKHVIHGDMDWVDLAILQAVCCEIIAERGWDLSMYYDADHKHWDARIMDGPDEMGNFDEIADYDAPELPLAIATALLSAIKAEKP